MRNWRFSQRSVIAGGLLLGLAAAGCNSSSSTQPRPPDPSLAGQLQALVDRHGLPGAVGIVLQGPAAPIAQAAGVRRAGAADSVQVEDLFHIGSITKSMTATTLASLIDDGILRWDSRPLDCLPELADSMHPGYAAITLRDLLRHRAGSPADEDIGEQLPTFAGSLIEQRRAASLWVLRNPPAGPVGEYRYSNAGYVIAAAMAEAASGQGWRELMTARLFAPLGIAAHYGWPTEHDPDQPWGHEPASNGYASVEPAVDLPFRFIEPAGFVSMSIADLGKFMRLHLDADQDQPALLSQAAFDSLHAPAGDYACGLVVAQGEFGPLYLHNGSNGFFFSIMYLLPGRNLAAAIMVNAGGDEAGLRVQLSIETVLEALLE